MYLVGSDHLDCLGLHVVSEFMAGKDE